MRSASAVQNSRRLGSDGSALARADESGSANPSKIESKPIGGVETYPPAGFDSIFEGLADPRAGLFFHDPPVSRGGDLSGQPLEAEILVTVGLGVDSAPRVAWHTPGLGLRRIGEGEGARNGEYEGEGNGKWEGEGGGKGEGG